MRNRRNISLRILLVLLLISGALGASAQHYIGVMGGWGGGNARFKPAMETGYEWGLYTGGVSYKFYSPEKYIGGIEIDLMFTQKGFNYDLEFESDSSYHRRVNAIQIPLIWQPHFYMLNRHARFFINLGIQLSYNLNSTYSYVSKTNGVYESGKYTMQLNRDNRFDYGLCGGAGLAFLLGQQRRYEFSVEARYSFGYGDILRNSTRYKGNPDRSPLDCINVYAAFYYRLGKGGIRSAPGAATQRRMEEEAARHTLRRLNRQLEKGRLPSDSLILKAILPDSINPTSVPIDSTTIEAARRYLTTPADTTTQKPDGASPSVKPDAKTDAKTSVKADAKAPAATQPAASGKASAPKAKETAKAKEAVPAKTAPATKQPAEGPLPAPAAKPAATQPTAQPASAQPVATQPTAAAPSATGPATTLKTESHE